MDDKKQNQVRPESYPQPTEQDVQMKQQDEFTEQRMDDELTSDIDKGLKSPEETHESPNDEKVR